MLKVAVVTTWKQPTDSFAVCGACQTAISLQSNLMPSGTLPKSRVCLVASLRTGHPRKDNRLPWLYGQEMSGRFSLQVDGSIMFNPNMIKYEKPSTYNI